MKYLTPYEITSSVKWETEPTTEMFIAVATAVGENIIEINEMIQEALRLGKTEINIDPLNLITIN